MRKVFTNQDKAAQIFNYGKSVMKEAGHDISKSKDENIRDKRFGPIDYLNSALGHTRAAFHIFEEALKYEPNDKLKKLILRKMSGLPSNNTYIDRQMKKMDLLRDETREATFLVVDASNPNTTETHHLTKGPK